MKHLKTFETFVPKKLADREDLRKKLEAEKLHQAALDHQTLETMLPTLKSLFPTTDLMVPVSKDKHPDPKHADCLSFTDRNVLVDENIKYTVVHWNIVDTHALGLDRYTSHTQGDRLIYNKPVSNTESLIKAVKDFPIGWSQR